MARIVIPRAGLGGMDAAYEILSLLGAAHQVAVRSDGLDYSCTPSNTRTATGSRTSGQNWIDVTAPARSDPQGPLIGTLTFRCNNTPRAGCRGVGIEVPPSCSNGQPEFLES